MRHRHTRTQWRVWFYEPNKNLLLYQHRIFSEATIYWLKCRDGTSRERFKLHSEFFVDVIVSIIESGTD